MAASSKSYLPRTPNYRFLHPSNHHHQTVTDDSSMMFELDESDVWNFSSPPASALSQSPQDHFRKPSASRISRKLPGSSAAAAASMPVNVPDWSKILKDEYRGNRRADSDDDGDYYDDVADGNTWIPPHELLTRRIAGTTSFSVHEGIGRTLKGRDLSRLRNAIWQKTGFQD